MRFIFFLILLFISLVTSAQLNLGLTANYGSSDIRENDDFSTLADQFDNASSLSFGILVLAGFSPVISLRSGLNINRRGTTFSAAAPSVVFGASVPAGGESKTRFTYVDVPLLLQVQLATGTKLYPYLFAGPTFGYATTGNVRTTAESVTSFNLMTTNIGLEDIGYERFHVAAVGGLGLRIKLSESFSTFLEGSYEQSFSDPYEVPLATANTGYQGVRFGAGFMFRLGEA